VVQKPNTLKKSLHRSFSALFIIPPTRKGGVMKNHSRGRVYGLSVLLIIALIIFSLPASISAQTAPLKAILNVPWGAESAVGIQHKDFVDLTKEKTKGRLQISAYYGASLYGLDQQPAMLQKNVIQFGAQSGWYWQKLDPACTLTWCPFFFPNKQKMAQWYRSKAVQKFLEDYMGKKYGMMNLPDIGWVGSNPLLWSTDWVLDSLDKMKGKRIATWGDTDDAFFGAFGGMGLSTNFRVHYTQLQTKMVDGAGGTAIPNLKTCGLGEFTRFRHLPFLYHNALSTIANPVFWKKLPKDIQNIILNEVCPEVEKRATDRIQSLEASMIKFAEEKIGQKEILVPPEVFFPMLDWVVKNIWEKRIKEYPAGLPLWEEGAKVVGYGFKDGKFSGVKEAWEGFYVQVYGGKLKK
jgi:TRAP-type C4-dicarboxylate transport system substrate-binding protein